MALRVLDNPTDLVSLRPILDAARFVAFDCETTGLTARHEIIGYSLCMSENDSYYVVLAKWSRDLKKLEYIPGMRESSEPLIKSLQGKELIMHNGLFDCQMVEAFFKIRLIDSLHTDTLALAHLLDENRSNALKSLAKDYFGTESTNEQAEMKASVIANGGILTKSNYELYKADAYLLGKYGAQDALLTYKLFYVLLEELVDQQLDSFFYEEETMPLLRTVTYDLNTTGIQIDMSRLISLKKTLQAECLEARDFIYREIDSLVKHKYPGTSKTTTFNIGASQQLSWLLFGELALEFGTLTDSGKAVCRQLGLKLPYSPSAKREFIRLCSAQAGGALTPPATVNGKKIPSKKIKNPWAYIKCDKSTLQKYASHYKWVERLLEYQRKLKLLTTYVTGIEERMAYGIIQPQFKQVGTTSGRYSSSNPNFQNLPRDDKRIKECVVSRPGQVFVGADYSQLEPRVFAYISQDKNLMAAFEGSDDFYSVIGIRTFDKYDAVPQKDGHPDAFGIKYKKLRDISKVIALATTYGANANRLAPTVGKSTAETQEIIDRYFEQFPDVRKMMLESHAIAKQHGQVTNLFGRPRRIPEAKRITKLFGDGDLPYEYRSLLNLAVNHRVQSTAASIVNRAAIAFKRLASEAGLQGRIVIQVHDSLVVECPESQALDISTLLQFCMEETVSLPGVRLEAIPKIGKNLSEV